MAGKTQGTERHLGDLLSAYIDGKLTQQQRQQVEVHCGSCGECRENLEKLQALRARIAGARLSEVGEDPWREAMEERGVALSRGIGWLLILAGLLVAVGIVGYGFFTESGMSLGEKAVIAGIYGGLAVLLFSVLRQRLIERRSDRYKDVEI